jgi:hypothetical protein
VSQNGGMLLRRTERHPLGRGVKKQNRIDRMKELTELRGLREALQSQSHRHCGLGPQSPNERGAKQKQSRINKIKRLTRSSAILKILKILKNSDTDKIYF